MSRQYHYVVVWDVEENRFFIESETAETNFPNGEVWNKDTQEWESRNDSDEVNEEYLDREDALADVLDERNEMLKELTADIRENNG